MADSAAKKSQPANVDELGRRLAVAAQARESGNVYAAAQANKAVISLALRQLGQLRLVQLAYPQAVEIYRRSLDFEESIETREGLAIAQFGAKQFDEALASTDQVLKQEPRNARASVLRGRALMAKQDYTRAAEALSGAAQISPDIETYYSLGICYLAEKNANREKNAADAFQKMKAIAGDSGSLHVLFGRAYRDANDMPTAIAEFQKAVALDTRTPHAHYFLALAKLAVNEWKPTPEIKEEFRMELEFHPKDYLANYMLGYLASSERQYDVSDRYLHAAAEIGPSWPDPWLYLGLNAYAREEMKPAEEYLRKAVALTGDDESRSNFQIRRAYVDLGRILSGSGREQEAETFLAKARDLQKKTMELSQHQISTVISEAGGMMGGVAELKPDKDVESAALRATSRDLFARVDASVLAASNFTEEQRKALVAGENRLRAVLALAFNDLATSEAVGGQFHAALGHYQDAERWDSATKGLYRNLGLAAYRVQNFSEAIRGLSKEVAANPDDTSARAVLGSVYFSADDYANAVKTISPLGERAMHDPVVGYAWAASLMHLGDFTQASKILAEVEKLSLTPDTLLLVGKLWVELEDYSRAVSAFEHVLAADPKQPKVHYSAGLAYLRWQHLPEAIAQFNAQLQLTPGDADTINGMGLVYLEQGKREEAGGLFRAVVDNHPENGNAQYQFGKLLLDDGNVKEAVKHLELAAKALPQSDYVHYQLQAAYRKDARIEDADRELELYKELKARNRQASIPRPSPNSQ